MTYAEVMNIVGPVILASVIMFCWVDPFIRGERSFIHRFARSRLARREDKKKDD